MSKSSPAGKPSIRDVAARAGVSYQTVSRVLNDRTNIRAGTRDRVLEAMHELGYRPNRAARMLATSRSRLIGVVATVNGGYYGPTSIISAIEDAARAGGYAIMLTTPRNLSAAELSSAVEHLLREGVEGIIAVAPQTRAADAMSALADPVPAVILQADGSHGDIGLSVDNELGAGLAVRHLVELGHRRIAVLNGPGDWTEAIARTRGFVRSVHDAGAEVVGAADGDWTAESGYRGFQQLVGCGATAVFCANDQMALGLLHAASDRGLRTPVDLSVVGFDDVPEAAHYIPPLTTIRQDFDELGRRAIAALLARVERDEPLFRSAIPPRLIVRASTLPIAPTRQAPRTSRLVL
ncbi:MAG: LacI family DNA-binding transcriptional regulator [Promicromonosporaceae bacterium]|nr:LacI family DNA-binding transcriptional regulator [Promicromonosporaceae bacterium]